MKESNHITTIIEFLRDKLKYVTLKYKNSYDCLTNINEEITILQIVDDNKTDNHVITIVDDLIFDTNK